MSSKLFQRVRHPRSGATASRDRAHVAADRVVWHHGAEHVSPMPSQRASTRFQRPY
ncbi:hypothetical protein [Aquihabitans sp. McL0605]|uniref:hypothetical protein n=1 Tax=Aquihabitans sp. McL0605 TaxID=3415671 RepID=UPI003CF737BF